MSSWSGHVMWWHVYPLGFTGAPIRPAEPEAGVVHRLTRLLPWLDHLVELGLNGLSLGPIFESRTHGYDTTDHYRIDPRLGDDGDFDVLVTEARRRGIRILLDGVFNHVGRTHPMFQDVERRGPDSPHAPLFSVDWTGWSPGRPVPARVFEGHDQLVELDHDSDAAVDLVSEVMAYWLGRGIDGWRLDAAYAVPPAFWRRVLDRVRPEFPDAWFSGEVIQGDASAFVAASGVDSLTQYELWQGIWHGIADRNFYELAHAIERHNALLDRFVPSTFIGNHDVTRIATAVGTQRLDHAVALLFTLAGVPSVYYGDEYALTGLKEAREGGDDAVRPEFPDAPADEAGLSPEARHALTTHRRLIAFRRQHPWLHTARADVAELANEHLVLRMATDDQQVVVALNLSDRSVDVDSCGATSVAHGVAELAGRRLTLPPLGWAVLTG